MDTMVVEVLEDYAARNDVIIDTNYLHYTVISKFNVSDNEFVDKLHVFETLKKRMTEAWKGTRPVIQIEVRTRETWFFSLN